MSVDIPEDRLYTLKQGVKGILRKYDYLDPDTNDKIDSVTWEQVRDNSAWITPYRGAESDAIQKFIPVVLYYLPWLTTLFWKLGADDYTQIASIIAEVNKMVV